MKNGVFKKLTSLVLVLAMVLVLAPVIPVATHAAEPGKISTSADPQTLTRPNEIYGDNTQNAGKVTVGKSVSDSTVTLPTGERFTPAENNFLVTISQFAQVMGLASQSQVPVDAVFVLDTSGSMDDYNRAESMVSAANTAIAALMASNPNNRVSVVAFSRSTQGGGTSNGEAANVLSSLSHYDGEAATAHLSWSGSYIQGRDVIKTVTTERGDWIQTGRFPWEGYYEEVEVVTETRANRHGYRGGTHIQAGIALGAQQLMNATPTATVGDKAVTRMPFLIILSDGAATFSADSSTWYTPSMTSEQGDGSNPYEGNGFLAALTAAYYKGAITEHYYGTAANAENRCFVYTIGVDLDELSGDDEGLAQITMDPATYTTGNYALESSDSYYIYGNSFNNNRNTTHGFRTYWNNFVAGSNFSIRVDDGETFTVTSASISAAKNYVMGKSKAGSSLGYNGGLAYNDDYFDASNPENLTAVFQSLVTTIQQKAISAPTHVDTSLGDNFSGYVTFTDPIGEYMEVKQMLGVVADGNHDRGRYVAQNIGSNGTDADFDAALAKVLNTRLTITASSGVTAEGLIAAASSNNTYNGKKTQAYYNSDSDYSNSIAWWGKTYTSADGFEQGAQCLGHAVDDSIAYIEDANTVIPEGADVVCRSYFFYGINSNTNQDYLYFVVRVQRSLTAPYQQTVVISAPASLLAAETVLITEKTSNSGTTYTATVTENDPARVLYEVGLRSDINAQNVAQIVSADYANEKVNGSGSVNYDAATDTYSFFTNDWDRTQSQSSHHRAMTKATFNAAAHNSFYTYQEDTQVLNADGSAYTGTTAPSGTYYYARTVYDWSADTTATGGDTYDAVKKSVLIRINIPAGTEMIQKDGAWYIPAGDYTALTLQVTGDDTEKTDNTTGTSEVVAHPHRTGTANDNHYTVFLGNNGKLTLVSDPAKTVKIGDSTENNNGDSVMVGQILTYEIKVVNNEGAEATAVVTDTVPTGTKLVSGSISDGGQIDSAGKITWNLTLAKDETKTVSFKVEVLPDALSGKDDVQDVTNTATIQVGNNPAYVTNTTHNPPEGKKVVDANGDNITGSVKVGDILVYRIRFYNDTAANADVTITDIIPTGTTYIDGSATHGGTHANGTLTWVISDVQPGYDGVVSFEVVVDASAKQNTAAGATQPDSGDITISNNAAIQIGANGPKQTTNSTETKLSTGSMSVTKRVETADKQNETFTVVLSDTRGNLSGTYVLESSVSGASTVTFTGGKSGKLTIRHGETLTVKGLPIGTGMIVEEVDLAAGWTATYADNEPNDVYEQRVLIYADEAYTVTVTNRYAVTPVSFRLKGTKTYVGSNFPEGSYSFYAKASDENGNILTGNDAISVFTTVDYPNTSFTFSTREFTKAETRYYVVDEAATAIPGVTSSGVKYLLRLQIEDVNAKLVVTASYKTGNGTTWSDSWTAFDWEDGSVEFINTYAPKETAITIGGTKQLTGRHLKDGEFSFQLYYNGTAIATSRNDVSGTDPDSGSFTFAPVSVTVADMDGAESKEFIYYIREIQSGLTNVDFDAAIYEIKVTIEDKDGQLTETGRTVTRYENAEAQAQGQGTAANGVLYSNTFNVEDTHITLSGNKTLSGAGANGLKGEDFTFVIYEADSGFTADTSKVVSGTGNAADTDAADGYVGAITFANISYTAEQLANVEANGNGIKTRDFYYVAQEMIPAADQPSFDVNMKYDATKYNIHVRVTLDTATGALSAQILSVNGTDVNATSFNALNFENIKNPATVTYTPVGQKTTTGAAAPGLRFSFRVVGLGTDVQNLTRGTVEATGVSDGKKITGDNISFTSLVYTAEDVGKTYYYVIEEASVDAGSMVTYDDTQYLLAVTVGRDNNNALTATPAYYWVTAQDDFNGPQMGDSGDNGYADDITFTNAYNATASLNISATKRFSGRTLKTGEFDFRLQLLNKLSDGGYQVNTAAGVINGVNAADGTVSFGTLLFTYNQINDSYLDRADEADSNVKYYHFPVLMTEIVPETAKIPGVTYDSTAYIVIVEWKVTFTEGIPTDSVDPYVVSVYKASASSGVYTATGENLFADDPATAVVETGATFTNRYEPTSTTVTIEATKVLTGRELQANEFTFELYRGDTLVETSTNAKNGKIVFTRTYPSNISSDYFTADSDNNGHKEATFTYTLKEVATTKGGITYSGAEYTIVVVIEHNTNTAALSVKTVTYTDKEGTEITDLSQVTFENIYSTNDVSVTPTGSKQLLGAGNSAVSMQNYAFSFQAFELDAQGNRIVIGGTAEAPIYKIASTGTSDANGKITFSPIGYTLTDTGVKVYEIREMDFADGHITVDPTVYYLRVVISHDEGVLSAAESYHATKADAFDGTNALSAAPTFVNHHGAGYINLALDVDKVVQSTNTDSYTLLDSQFDFTVYNAADVTNGKPNAGATPVSVGSNDASGNIHFASVTIQKSQLTNRQGVFTYVILEEVPPDAAATGITVDPKAITVTVTVTDDGYGNLSATYAYADGDNDDSNNQKFVNKYTAKSTEAVIYAHKDLIGKNLAAGEFTFLLDNNAGTVLTQTNDASGNVAFTVTYTATGTYTYTLTEQKGQNANTEYDDTAFTVVVTVTDGGGKLTASVAYSNADNAVPLFVNTYTPPALEADLTVALDGTKTVVDANGNPYGSPAGFTFAVTDLSGNPVLGADGQPVIGTSNASGQIVFTDFYFTQAGEYHYWIREQASTKPGYTVDPTVWEVHILVRYNAGPEAITADGKTVESGYLYYIASEVNTFVFVEGGVAAQSGEVPMDFVNKYEPTPAETALKLTKELTGRPLNAGEFTFFLTRNGEIVSETTNAVNGDVFFNLKYTVPGTYVYTIAEQEPADKLGGIIYDTTAHTVTVEVKDENGVLKAYLNGTSGSELVTGITITNKYTARDVDAFIEATKTIEGKELSGNDFSFQLLDAGGKVLQTVKNAASGKVSFKISYTKADLGDATEKTFHYTVREVNDSQNGVTYDTAEYGVIVTVSDDLNGTLHALVAYETADQNAPVFKNTYKPTPVDVVLEGTKILKGRTLKAGEFQFIGTKPDGTEVAKGTQDENGKITFSNLHFIHAGTFTVHISEVKGSEKGMIYDDTVFVVTVEVTDVDGDLVANVIYPDGGVVFENTYKKPGNPNTGDEFQLALIIGIMAVSALGLGAVLVLGRKKKEEK